MSRCSLNPDAVLAAAVFEALFREPGTCRDCVNRAFLDAGCRSAGDRAVVVVRGITRERKRQRVKPGMWDAIIWCPSGQPFAAGTEWEGHHGAMELHILRCWLAATVPTLRTPDLGAFAATAWHDPDRRTREFARALVQALEARDALGAILNEARTLAVANCWDRQCIDLIRSGQGRGARKDLRRERSLSEALATEYWSVERLQMLWAVIATTLAFSDPDLRLAGESQADRRIVEMAAARGREDEVNAGDSTRGDGPQQKRLRGRSGDGQQQRAVRRLWTCMAELVDAWWRDADLGEGDAAVWVHERPVVSRPGWSVWLLATAGEPGFGRFRLAFAHQSTAATLLDGHLGVLPPVLRATYTMLRPVPGVPGCRASREFPVEVCEALAPLAATILTAAENWLLDDRLAVPADLDPGRHEVTPRLASALAVTQRHLDVFAFLHAWEPLTIEERRALCFEPLLVRMLDPDGRRRAEHATGTVAPLKKRAPRKRLRPRARPTWSPLHDMSLAKEKPPDAQASQGSQPATPPVAPQPARGPIHVDKGLPARLRTGAAGTAGGPPALGPQHPRRVVRGPDGKLATPKGVTALTRPRRNVKLAPKRRAAPRATGAPLRPGPARRPQTRPDLAADAGLDLG